MTSAPETFPQMPANLEAEQALLGALLMQNQALERVSGFLTAAHFHEPLHGRIYGLISDIVGAGKQASPITIKSYVETDRPISDDLTVYQYIVRLASHASSIINAREYGQIIYDLAIRRELIGIGQDIVNTAFMVDLETPPAAQIEQAEAKLYAIAETGSSGPTEIAFSSSVDRAMQAITSAVESGGKNLGLSTGLVDLDRKIAGLIAPDLIIIAGRPSMGKTALVTNIARHLAKRHMITGGKEGARVLFFSLEMSDEQLSHRILAEEAEVSGDRLRRGDIDRRQLERVGAAAARLSAMPLFTDKTGGLKIAQLAARARRAKRRHGIGLVIVDYLQLMTSGKEGGRVQELTEITTGLKALAKELNLPVIALSQLSRDVEKRPDKRPQLSDLRDSGSIEQDADIVMFVFREEYYVEREKPSDGSVDYPRWQARMQSCAGKSDIIIGKNRQGSLGIVQVAFSGELTRFSNLARAS